MAEQMVAFHTGPRTSMAHQARLPRPLTAAMVSPAYPRRPRVPPPTPHRWRVLDHRTERKDRHWCSMFQAGVHHILERTVEPPSPPSKTARMASTPA